MHRYPRQIVIREATTTLLPYVMACGRTKPGLWLKWALPYINGLEGGGGLSTSLPRHLGRQQNI